MSLWIWQYNQSYNDIKAFTNPESILKTTRSCSAERSTEQYEHDDSSTVLKMLQVDRLHWRHDSESCKNNIASKQRNINLIRDTCVRWES